MASAADAGRYIDPLGTIPLFDVNIPLTPSDPAIIRGALAGLATIGGLRHDLDQHEHDLITQVRAAGATWRQIAASLGFKNRQAAQQRHQALAHAITSRPNPSQTRTPQR